MPRSRFSLPSFRRADWRAVGRGDKFKLFAESNIFPANETGWILRTKRRKRSKMKNAAKVLENSTPSSLHRYRRVKISWIIDDSAWLPQNAPPSSSPYLWKNTRRDGKLSLLFFLSLSLSSKWWKETSSTFNYPTLLSSTRATKRYEHGGGCLFNRSLLPPRRVSRRRNFSTRSFFAPSSSLPSFLLFLSTIRPVVAGISVRSAFGQRRGGGRNNGSR